jgi:UPF0271 protein
MCAATREAGPELIWLCPAGPAAEAARAIGLNTVEEVYADRAYHPDKRLVSRKTRGAVIKDSVVIRQRLEQLLRDGTLTTIEGQRLPLDYQSICVHGDTPGALEIAKMVRAICAEFAVAVKPLRELLS